MDRIANLDQVLSAIREAVVEGDWAAAERLSERSREAVLDAALSNDRPGLEDLRERLAAFRSAMARRLDEKDPAQAALAVLLRADATLASIATRMRPSGLAASQDAGVRSAVERVLHYLAGRLPGACTGDIANACGIAQGTTSRLLTELKAQGLVTSRNAGRLVISRLTPRGRAAAGDRPRVDVRRALAKAPSLKEPAMEPIVNRSPVARASWLEVQAPGPKVEARLHRGAARLIDVWFSEPGGEGISNLEAESLPINASPAAESGPELLRVAAR